jgi:hypothetical protein
MPMEPLHRLVPQHFQPPRFRDGDKIAKQLVVPDGETYQTDALCDSYQEVLRKSRVIFGSRYYFVPWLEVHKLRPSLDDLKQSVIESHCHFCTLVWHVLSDGQEPGTLRTALGNKVSLRIYYVQGSDRIPRISVRCEGIRGQYSQWHTLQVQDSSRK